MASLGVPTIVAGSVTLSDGATLIGTADLLNGQASFTTSALTLGSHTITATPFATAGAHGPAGEVATLALVFVDSTPE